MELAIERLAFDSLRNLGEVAEPVKQKGPCDDAEQKGKEQIRCCGGQQGPGREGSGGQGREFGVDSRSRGNAL